MSLTKILPELRAIVGGVVVFLGLKIGKYFLAGHFFWEVLASCAHIFTNSNLSPRIIYLQFLRVSKGIF